MSYAHVLCVWNDIGCGRHTGDDDFFDLNLKTKYIANTYVVYKLCMI
jgi:hypothetical protein